MTAPARSGYHHGDLRSALVEAGNELLAEKGAAALSLRSVAKKAGVSHAAPYRHFRDKEALLEALAADGLEQLKASVDASTARFPDDPERQLFEGSLAYLRHVVANPRCAHLMFGGILDPHKGSKELREAAESSFSSLVDTVRRGQAAGIFAPAPTREIVLSVWSTVHGLAMLIMARQMGPLGLDDDIEQLWRIVGGNLLRGLLR